MSVPSILQLKEQLLETLPTPIVIKNFGDGTILYQNAAAAFSSSRHNHQNPNQQQTNDTDIVTTTIPLHNDNGTIVALAEWTTDQQTPSTSPSASELPRVDSGSSLAGVHDNEISYRILFQNLQMGAALGEVVTDERNRPIDFVILDVNPVFDELTGLSSQNIIGQRITHVVPNMDPWMIDAFGAVAMGGPAFKFRNQQSVALGRWFAGVAYSPAELRFVVLLLDVSEHVQAEETIQESEERHRNLFESMMQGVVYQEASGAIIAANQSAERILGLTVDQMMGRTSVDPRWRSIHEDGSDFPGETHPSMVALKTGKPEVGVVMGVFHPVDQKTHWIIIDAIPRIKPGETKPYQVYTTFTDLTETKEFERKILLEKERAEMADRLKSSFLANMSHEIRTPLNGIMGHIDLALSNDLAEASRPYNLEGLRVAKESGNLLLAIIEDILDISKIEAGQMDVKTDEVFSLRHIVEQTSSVGRTMIQQKKKSIELMQHICPDIADSICGDPFRLQQVMINLVSNAIKFTEEGNVQILVTKKDESVLEICVADTGKGIPIDHIETIFDSFRQVEIGDTRKHGGTGLGLTISRKLAELMGGSLSVESHVDGPNRGSRFFVLFPYKLSTCSGATAPDAFMTERSRTKTSNGDKNTILVAEDETVSRRLVKRMLEVSGYRVIVVEDGQQAIEVFKTRDDIALILMDVQMPNMDGLEATEVIRKLEGGRLDPVPIIALSAGAMKGDHEEGLAVGMTDYLTKPVNLKILLRTVGRFIGARENQSCKEG